MKIEDYSGKIALFLEANPCLSHEDLAVVLTADQLYKDIPEDLYPFRNKYAHFDPAVLDRPNEGITFLRIAGERNSEKKLQNKLNAYMNIKFHHIKHEKSYAANVSLFKEKSIIASSVIDEILGRAGYPNKITEVMREREDVRSCYDFHGMLQLYKSTKDVRLHYEIIRKIGLIVLIARIRRTVEMDDLEYRQKEVWQAFDKGLRRSGKRKKQYFLWLNVKHKVDFATEEPRARKAYEKEVKARRKDACRIYPLQKFVCQPFTTFSGNEILHMEIRSKFGKKGQLSYASYIEKMIRKNLEFPNQVHDTIGVKIVVEKEDRIEGIIRELESFLGGSSTRKMEKNSYHRFGRRRLSEFSSPEYFVWKAIYDITLPHPSVPQIRRMLRLTKDSPAVQKELKDRLNYFFNNPRDFVIEVQLQDIRSYLLSIVDGSHTSHDRLKMNQIRSNSFYKIFPGEIYEKDIKGLKQSLLGRSVER